MKLQGKKIGILLENDFCEHEIWYYRHRFAEEGAELEFLTRLWGAPRLTFTGHDFRAPLDCWTSLERISDGELAGYAAILVPSGFVADRLRYSEDLSQLPPAVEFLRRAFANPRILKGFICHGLWLLSRLPGLIQGRRVVAHNNVYGDVCNMGAQFVNEDVVVDGDVVTGRSADHCHLFARRIIEILAGA